MSKEEKFLLVNICFDMKATRETAQITNWNIFFHFFFAWWNSNWIFLRLQILFQLRGFRGNKKTVQLIIFSEDYFVFFVLLLNWIEQDGTAMGTNSLGILSFIHFVQRRKNYFYTADGSGCMYIVHIRLLFENRFRNGKYYN